MHNTLWNFRCVSCALMVLWVALAGPAAAADLTGLIPPDALLVIQVRDVPTAIRQWQASPFYRFYRDPRARGFFQPLQKELDQLEDRMIRRQQVTPGQLARFFSGGLLLVGMPAPAGADNPLEWVLIFEHNGDPEVLEKFQAERRANGLAIRRTREAREGYTYTRVQVIREEAAAVPIKLDGGLDAIPNGAAEPPASGGVKRQVIEEYHDWFGKTLGVHADSTGRPIEAVLDRIARAGQANAPDSFQRMAAEQQLARRIPAPADLEAFVNVAGLSRWLERRQAAGEQSQMVNLRALALGEMQWLSVGMDLQPDRLALSLDLRIPNPPTGLAQILMLSEGRPLDAAAWMPPDALYYSSTAMPLAQTWAKSWALFAAASPTLHALVETQFKSLEQTTAVNIPRDLFGHLGDHVMRLAMPAPGTQTSGDLTTYLVELKDPKPVGEAVAALLQYGSQVFGAFQIERSTLPELEGEPGTLWTLRSGRPGSTWEGQPIFHVGLAGHWAFLGARRDGMDAVLARMRNKKLPNLSTQKNYQAAMATLPAERFWVGFADLSGFFRMIDQGWLVMSKKSESNGLLPLDEAALPDASIWGEFFGPTGSSRSRLADGLTMQAFLLYQ